MIGKTTCGVDMSKDTFDAELVLECNRKRKKFSNTPEGFAAFMSWCLSFTDLSLLVVLEATGRYGDAFARYLHDGGHDVRIANPKRVRRFAEGLGLLCKTDKADAHAIAEYARCHSDRILRWTPKSPTRQALADLRCHIRGLEKEIAAIKNRAGSGITQTFVADSNERVLEVLQRELSMAQALAAEMIHDDEQLRKDKEVLVTQIGVGEHTALVMLTRVDFRAFPKARKVARYGGLTPKREQSGTSLNKEGRISKEGPADLRAALYNAARSAIQHDPQMRDFADRLRARQKPGGKIIVAVMRKILVRSWAIVTHRN